MTLESINQNYLILDKWSPLSSGHFRPPAAEVTAVLALRSGMVMVEAIGYKPDRPMYEAMRYTVAVAPNRISKFEQFPRGDYGKPCTMLVFQDGEHLLVLGERRQTADKINGGARHGRT